MASLPASQPASLDGSFCNSRSGSKLETGGSGGGISSLSLPRFKLLAQSQMIERAARHYFQVGSEVAAEAAAAV